MVLSIVEIKKVYIKNSLSCVIVSTIIEKRTSGIGLSRCSISI